MTDHTEPMRALANRSGYPFQMAVTSAIKEGAGGSWEVVGEEVPWSGGFVDLVLKSHGGGVLVTVECKRLEEATLVFPVDADAPDDVTRLRLEFYDCEHCSGILPHAHEPRLFCTECNIRQSSFEASYCITPKNEGGVTSLEPLCRDLLCASREIGQQCARGVGRIIMLPLLVTNADLAVLQFDPAAVSLTSGKVEKADGTGVEMMRFRKSFDADAHAEPRRSVELYRRTLTRDSERTVFVLTATSVVPFLCRFVDRGGLEEIAWR